jgi:hypothetical protein
MKGEQVRITKKVFIAFAVVLAYWIYQSGVRKETPREICNAS